METVKMARIYLHEADHGKRRRLVQEVLDALRARGAHGVTVFRAIAGAGENGEAHAGDLLRSVVNLPEAVEFFDLPDRIERTLTELAEIVPAGRTIVWDASRR